MATNTSAPTVPVAKTITPFQTKLSTKAPSDQTKILSRSSPVTGVVTYEIQVGKVPVPGVTLAELLGYVSEYDLEVFENQQFQKDIVEEEAKQKERLAIKAQTLRQNRSVSSSDRGSASNASLSGEEHTRTAVGGRQRPTYTHFYPKQRAPRGSLNSKPTSTQAGMSYRLAVPKNNGANHRDNKRRRLREDRDGSMSSSQDAESIYSVASLDPPTQPPSAMEQAAGLVSDTHESDPMDVDDEESDNDINMPIRQPTEREVVRDKGKAAASAFFTFRDHAAPSTSKSAAPPNTLQQLSDKDKLVASLTARQASATTPSASATNSIKPASSNTNNTTTRQAVVTLDDSGSEDDSDNSEVYIVEKILGHCKSDPNSHNTSIHGEKPVMLYKVKWEGYDDTTWEPATSFQDDDVLQEYWAQQAQKQKQKPLASSSKDTAATLKGQRKGL